MESSQKDLPEPRRQVAVVRPRVRDMKKLT